MDVWTRQNYLFEDMNTFPILLIAISSFFVLVLAFFALSSCLGDEIRALGSTSHRQRIAPTTYGLQYARLVGHGGGHAGWEQIEMADMVDKEWQQD